MSLFKYFGEQGGPYGGDRLFWSRATNGIPFKGPQVPTLTQEELDTQVEVQYYFYSEFFDLSDEEAKKKYNWIMDRIVNGLFAMHFINRQVNHENQKITVYLEWSQRFAQLSPHAKDAGSPNNVFKLQGKPGGAIVSNLAGMQDPSAGF